jgi:ABC-2 type transport system permease protein
MEAMAFVGVTTAAALSSLVALRGIDLTALDLSQGQLATLGMQLEALTSSPVLVLVPVLERAIAIGLHVVLSVLAWSAFRRRKPLYLAAAVIYHAVVDGMAVYTAQFVENPWLLEGILAMLLLPGLFWLGRTQPHLAATKSHQTRTLPAQLRLFVAAVNKELWFQWRTRRVVVVAAVFMLFGLGSPLIAKFTPELLTSIEGAEQFAELIPVPTSSDAMDQYVRNITQFGFIIAILLGMGSVAGEKEKGTAAIILSKPLPRWAFILSKYVAQSLVFALGFLLAALGAYYYTSILFDGFAFGPFLFGNSLLLLWLMVFAAVTLLGSTIARTTGASAGIALLGSIVLLLAGSLPRIGLFFPSGLVAWASQLGLHATPTANGGALAANVVIILICLITAVAVLETQEL